MVTGAGALRHSLRRRIADLTAVPPVWMSRTTGPGCRRRSGLGRFRRNHFRRARCAFGGITPQAVSADSHADDQLVRTAEAAADFTGDVEDEQRVGLNVGAVELGQLRQLQDVHGCRSASTRARGARLNVDQRHFPQTIARAEDRELLLDSCLAGLENLDLSSAYDEHATCGIALAQ